MTREEILQIAKQILFNTDMVIAILDGRKSVTRRCIKWDFQQVYGMARFKGKWYETYGDKIPDDLLEWYIREFCKLKYKPSDYLYVRETWCNANLPGYDPDYYYYADTKICEDYDPTEWKWKPSIHMPKEAARIFLRVTDVRVERLQDIMKDPPGPNNAVVKEGCVYGCDFIAAWENTIPRKEREKYGWDANPWVWAIEFERVAV